MQFKTGGKSLTDLNEALLSFAFVRHPFLRLASCYHEKMVHEYERNGEQSEYRWLHVSIIVNYRFSGNFSHPAPYPTPEEFARYILSEAKRAGVKALDIHLRPQALACPWCQMDFDVIGFHDNFAQDLQFVFGSLGLMVYIIDYTTIQRMTIPRLTKWRPDFDILMIQRLFF